MSYKYPPVYIVGPTASGKSALALKLAQELDGVVISADSMQIYRGLDIGTAKATKEERALVEHKMIDIVDADSEFSVAEYAEQANMAIDEVSAEGKLPIVVGGTGLYIEALIYPMRFGNAAKNQKIRDELNSELEKYGAAALHAKLEKFDSETAARLHQNDTKRVIRALEIILSTGKTMSENADDANPEPDVIMIGLNTDRQKLYERINVRVDEMFANGLADEALKMIDRNCQSMQAIGYKEFKGCRYAFSNGKYVVNSEDLRRISELIKQHSRNYAKRQLTWFRRYPFIKWVECGDFDAASKYVKDKLKQKGFEV